MVSCWEYLDYFVQNNELGLNTELTTVLRTMSQPVGIGATLSGGRLGGISTMVTQADVCPSCGGHHETRRRPFWDRSGRTETECPVVVQGPFPVLMKLPETAEAVIELPFEIDSPRASSSSRDSEPTVLARRLGQLPIPWPALTFDEAYP